jgi:hypothetical protein
LLQNYFCNSVNNRDEKHQAAIRAADKEGMDLEGAAGDKVIDIFSTTSQNCLVCALEGKEACFYMKSVRGQGEEFNKIFRVRTENIYGTHQSFHSMYDLIMYWSLTVTLKFTELMKEYFGKTNLHPVINIYFVIERPHLEVLVSTNQIRATTDLRNNDYVFP